MSHYEIACRIRQKAEPQAVAAHMGSKPDGHHREGSGILPFWIVADLGEALAKSAGLWQAGLVDITQVRELSEAEWKQVERERAATAARAK
jgi:hypothetical protein